MYYVAVAWFLGTYALIAIGIPHEVALVLWVIEVIWCVLAIIFTFVAFPIQVRQQNPPSAP